MDIVLPVVITLGGAGAAWLARPLLRRNKISVQVLSQILAFLPGSAFIWLSYLAIRQGGVGENFNPLITQINWLPSVGFSAALYYDGLSALFGLLVTGIGSLVVIYAGQYFKNQNESWRFFLYLFLFMTAMLGLVLAGDLITLLIFWEGTSLTSFLLVGYKTKDAAARQGAFKALFITGAGGIALLAGFLLIQALTGTVEIDLLLQTGGILRQNPLYDVILILVAIGSFTKSAQAPFHIWLPSAMTAPTPASAYLHSATMVKAGIYLLARLNPILGQTEAWFWLLSIIGMATMLIGAYLGLKQNDIKALLAYSTISQLGVMVMLLGQDTDIAFKALVVAILAHALYKSALFMIAGIVDHETGTRDLRNLGGLYRVMPATFVITFVAALSMAGLPPLFGFLAKETLLAAVTHPSVPLIAATIFTASVVTAGALLLAQAGMLVVDGFLGKKPIRTDLHDAPILMWIVPAMPALISLLLALLPEPAPVAYLLANAAAAAFGAKVKVSFALWTGLSIPLLLSVVAVGFGSLLFIRRKTVRVLQDRYTSSIFENIHQGFLDGIDWAAHIATKLQGGKLRRYLAIMLVGVGFLFLTLGGPAVEPNPLSVPEANLYGELAILRVFSLGLTVSAALAAIFLRRDFFAIIAFGASGLSVAILMILEPAPDVALVQIIVDLLLVVVLVLALTRIPKSLRAQAQAFTYRQSRVGLARDMLLALGSGLLVAILTYNALTSRSRFSNVSPYFQENAEIGTGASDIVGAIITDFRGFDTLIEIAVFGIAGLGLYSLLRYASRVARDVGRRRPTHQHTGFLTRGIGGENPSAVVKILAELTLPLSVVIASVHILFGHNQPGDGFTAGVIVGLAAGFWYVVFGYRKAKDRLGWVRAPYLVGTGLALAMANQLAVVFSGRPFWAPFDYGKVLGLNLPEGIKFSTAFVFEVAIFLTVLGGVIAILNGLGHPNDDEEPEAGELRGLDNTPFRENQTG